MLPSPAVSPSSDLIIQILISNMVESINLVCQNAAPVLGVSW